MKRLALALTAAALLFALPGVVPGGTKAGGRFDSKLTKDLGGGTSQGTSVHDSHFGTERSAWTIVDILQCHFSPVAILIFMLAALSSKVSVSDCSASVLIRSLQGHPTRLESGHREYIVLTLTICGHLTRYGSQQQLSTKEEVNDFRRGLRFL
jgi:hypothetical protein